MLEGDIIHWKMPFLATNSQNVAIEIISACSCFEIEWPRDTFKLGEKGDIIGTFFSANQEGMHVKTVDVILRNETAGGYPVVKQFQIKMFVALSQVELENWQKAKLAPKIVSKTTAKSQTSPKKVSKNRQAAKPSKNKKH
jgi:hypothetical protein